MCTRWQNSFATFRDDMGPRPHKGKLERRDNDGPYAPDNCYWATQQQQMRNTRRTKRFTYKGESLTLGEWSERTGIPESALYFRIRTSGWEIARALTTPSQKKH